VYKEDNGPCVYSEIINPEGRITVLDNRYHCVILLLSCHFTVMSTQISDYALFTPSAWSDYVMKSYLSVCRFHL
jgi:hypothetical protein